MNELLNIFRVSAFLEFFLSNSNVMQTTDYETVPNVKSDTNLE